MDRYDVENIADRAAADAAKDAKNDAEFYTDEQIRDLRNDVRSEMRELRDELVSLINELRAELTGQPLTA